MRLPVDAPFGLQDSAFQSELAKFVEFVGPQAIDAAIRQVQRKFSGVSPQVAALFRERFFFHEKWLGFVNAGFQLDTSDLLAVRAASLIVVINRIRAMVSEKGQRHLKGMILDGLAPDRDVRHLEHELRCFTHFKQRRYDVEFADLGSPHDGKRFDLFVTTPFGNLEVECKTVSSDTGAQLKADLCINLFESFRKSVRATSDCGFYRVTFLKPIADCRSLPDQLARCFASDEPTNCTTSDFSVEFVERPLWQEALDTCRDDELRQLISGDVGRDGCAVPVQGKMVGLVLRPHKGQDLAEHVAKTIRQASKQCTGLRPCMVWVHYSGMDETMFHTLQSNGYFSAQTWVALRNAGTADRSHIERIRYSADPAALTRSPTLAPNRLLTSSVAANGAYCDVRNPNCRFPHLDL